MRLYLSSFRVGEAGTELVRLAGKNRKVAVIGNACDFRDDATRKERLDREAVDLQLLGFEPEDLDLRDYFDGSFDAKVLEGYGLVWVRGGNAFNLLRAMKYSGFDKVITEMLQQDTIVYGGYSAGVCVLSPNLHGIELCDNPSDIPEGYQPEIIWDGLNIIPYAVAPHYQSDHPESVMIDDVVNYFEQHGIVYKTMRDGESIIVEQ